MNGHFITTLGSNSPHHLPYTKPQYSHLSAKTWTEEQFKQHGRETHSFWHCLQEILDPETRRSEFPASEK